MALEVGQKRQFSFSDKAYRIREVLEDPGITMWWTWDSGLCPHCKQKIERKIEHVFYRIEILADDTKEDKDLKTEDIELVGDTLDRRKMRLTADKYDEVFKKSKLFKHLVKEDK